MKKTTLSLFRSICFLVFLFVFAIGLGQNTVLKFQDETYPMPENIASFQWNQMPESSKLADGYIGWVQFYKTPSQQVQDLFKKNNLELIEYIPHNTYLFYFPKGTSVNLLKNNGVRTIIPVDGSAKLSTALKNGGYDDYAKDGNNILVTLQFHKYVDAQFVIQELARKQIAVKQDYKGANTIDLSIPNNCLEDLSNLPYVKWVELISAPAVPDDSRGRSLHRSSNLDTQTSAGRNYTGVGIGVLCRDDGIVGPHIDFQGRIDNSRASGTGQSHGDGVSGIMAGAGNLNPLNRGMAASANLYVSNYASNFLDNATVSLINSGDVLITNSSYSDGCNDGYTSITQRVDTQVHTLPNLQHTFSAGNSNGNNCGYGAGSQWGNITGGHKQGKNVIATANVFFDGALVSSSSRGPARDGRIKPDIAANGQNQISTNENNTYQSFGGTSGASPGIAGVSAQLYQAYSEANGGVLPPSALIKATLLNTANDAGNVGPDFKFGWGIVNGLRAAKLIEENRFLSSTMTQGGSKDHTINVPSGTKQVRFMVYWSDSPAAPGANPALVNDLDLVVTSPANTVYLPFILDSTPDPTKLNLPATNGPDHLNNVEQVLINNPAAGNYNINIKGFNVPVGPQEYYVVYEIISDNITVTYPNAGESFVPGEKESIHWDAVPVNTTSNFVLEYSLNNGTSWNSITSVSSTTTNYEWTVPSSITGAALIRVSNGSFQDVSDQTFSIAPLVTNVQITRVCPTEATFTWNAATGAESYDLYILGEKYMEVVGTSNTNSIVIPISDPTAIVWYAAVAKNATNAWQGRRSVAKKYNGGFLDCTISKDISIQSNNEPSDFDLICNPGPVTISAIVKNLGTATQSNFSVSYKLDGEPAITETFTGTLNQGQEATYNFTQALVISNTGSHTLTVSVNLAGDENPNNDSDSLAFYAAFDAEPLDYVEAFDVNGVPPLGWNALNPDNKETWKARTVTGSNGASTVTAFMDNRSYFAVGAEDTLETLFVDLASATSAALSFDLAKVQYSPGFSDALRIDVSADCGSTFTQIYYKEGLNLATVSGYFTNEWVPTAANQWRTETIDLSAYLGEEVRFRIVNINNFGNSTFIDNFKVAGTLGVTENLFSSFSMYPNPATNEVFMSWKDVESNVAITLFNSLGQRLQQFSETELAGKTSSSLDVSRYAAGIYFITIKAGNKLETKKLIIGN